MSDLGAVLYVLDLDRAVRFYEVTTNWRVAGLESGFATLQSPSELASTVLTLVRIPEEIAADITITDPPERREETPIKLSFAVQSIAAVRSVAPSAGGVVDSPDMEWTFGAVRVCDGHDPEGNVVQFRESI
jgi:predicted enzyme related to lactoylglutathione lyase